MTVEAALRHKALDYERIALTPGPHVNEMQRIYGKGRSTVPGLLIDAEPVHGSRAILARLEELVPGPSLYPEPISDAVRDAERWGDEELQDLGRRLPWGALHFRPEAMGTFGGGGPLDGPGTDFAIGYVHASWKYHKITAARLREDLAGLPGKLEHIESLAEQGVIDGERPTAADLQLGATLRVLLTSGDLRPLIEGRAAERIARRWFPEYAGEIPAGAFPAGWVIQNSG
jgi:glutathione S-transferase